MSAPTEPPTTHWAGVWTTRDERDVSWYQQMPQRSLALIERYAPDPSQAVVDVGGGASVLVDHLLERGYQRLTVVDIAQAGLDRSIARLGTTASKVDWVRADATELQLPEQVDLWHDRAVLHFLTDPAQVQAYARRLSAALRPGGHAVIATFAPEGPTHCSGLPVQRYTAEQIAEALGLDLLEAEYEVHRTPSGADQLFTYAVLRRPT